MNEKFLNALINAPHLLAKMVKFVKDYSDATGIDSDAQLAMELKVNANDDSEPMKFAPKQKVQLQKKGLTNDEFSAVYGAYATAIVKEKAIEFIKGFVTGVMFK